MLRVAIIGFGGIAQTHRNGYRKLEKEGIVKLVAAYDIRKEAFTEQVEINLKTEKSDPAQEIHFYTDLEEMLRKEKLDFVDICTPSYLHKELAIKMLDKGYSVISEKPMALNSRDCKEMLEAEQRSGKHFMIAQCLRFFPEYQYLKEVIDSGKYGKVLAAMFHRNSAQPEWGYQNWYLDETRCGGAITDIHIHDVDMIRYLFGEPQSVACRAADGKTKYDICQTSFFYADSAPVFASGCWTPGNIPFSASYRVDFEHASLVMEKGNVTVYPERSSGEAFEADLNGYDGYTGELAYFCEIISGKTANKRNPASSAAKTISLIETMKKSADQNGKILPFCV